MQNTLKKANKKGFTLVELVIVIAILAILAAIAIPTVSNVITTANTNTDAANCQTIELALKSAHAEASAGTWTAKKGQQDSITVAEALTYEGLDLTTLKAGIKSVSSGTFTYKKDAKTGDIAVGSADSANLDLSATGLTVKEYLAGAAHS